MISKQRINAIETAVKRVNVPSQEEYEEAVYRAFKHFLGHMEADSVFIPAQEDTTDSGLIKAYELVYGEQKNTGLIERYLQETDQETEY